MRKSLKPSVLATVLFLFLQGLGTGATYMSAFEFNGNTQDSAGDYKIELEEKITFGGGVEKESLDFVGDAWVKLESKLNDKLFENDKCRIKLRFKTLNSADGDSSRRFIFGVFNQLEPGGNGGDWDPYGGDGLALALDVNDEGDQFQFVAKYGDQSINFAALKSFSAQTWHDIDIILNLGTENRSAIFTLDGTMAKIELEDDYNIEALKEHLRKQSFYIGVDPVQISTTGQDEVYDGIHAPSETNISIDYLKFQFQDQSTLVGDSEVIRDLLVKFTQYVSGALDLSNDQQKSLMVAYSLEWDGSYEQVKAEVSNYLAAFDASRQVLFSKTRAEIDPRTMGYPEQLAFNLRQWIHDELFEVGNISAVAGVSFPSAEVFPGLPKNGAPRVASVDVSVNGSYVSDKAVGNEDARHAIRLTGFYAAPGEVITLEFDSSSVGKGLNIVVGAHIFDTEGRQKFNRFPRVSKTFPVTSASVDVANPFGGSLMIEVPDGVELGEINIKIKNAINAPFYSTRSARKTTTQEWNEDLLNAHVPWIELESDKFIVIAPMSLYQGEDPATILSEWDNIMDAFSIVGGRPLERSRGEGVLVDSMLFVGGTAAPASYPINVSTDVYHLGADRYATGTHSDVWSNPFNPKPSDTDIGRSKFIVLHELGHRAMYPQLWEEHETIVNLPAVAAYNLTYGMDLATEAFEHSIHQRFTMDEAAVDWMISPNFRGNKRMGFDLVDFGGTEGQELRYQNRGHAKYVDIAYLFGWDEFSKINKVFYEMGRIMGRRITALVDARERDDYYIRVASIALNRNLSPLFHFWGIIPSEQLVRELSVLPTPEMIKIRLEHYKTLIPANNSEFVSHYTSSGAPDAHQKIRYDNLSNNYNESLSDSIVFQIDGIIAKYFESNKSAPGFTEDPSYKSYPVGESFSLTLGVEDSDTPQNRLSFSLVVNSGIRDMSMLPKWFKFNEQTGEISGVSEEGYQTPELSIVVSDVAHTVYSAPFKLQFYEPDIDDPEGWPIWQNGESKDITVYEGESYLHEINLVSPLGFPYPYDLRFAKLPEWNPLAPFYHVNDWILPGWMVQDEGELYLYPTSDLIGVHKYFLHFLGGAQPFKITVAPNDSSILLHGTPPEEIFATEPFSFLPDLILGKQFVAIGGGSVERSLNLVAKSPIAPNLLIEKKHVPTNVSFLVENLPVWAHLDQKTGEIFGTPFYNQLGDFKNIKITAVSGDEMATLPAFDIKVVFRDDDPKLIEVPKLSAYAGVEFRYDLDVKTLSERNQNHTFASELPIWMRPYQLNEFFKSDDGQIKYRRDSSANTMPSWLSLDGDQWYISGRPLLSDVGVHEGIELTFRFRADSGPGIDKMYFSPVSVFTIEVFDDPTKQPPVFSKNGGKVEGELFDVTYKDYSGDDFNVSADDPQDGDLTAKIVKTGFVDRNIPWLYPVTHTVTDSDGNVSTATFKVQVMASDYKDAPVIETQTLNLKEGWNLVSFYVEADDMTTATVFAPIQGELLQVKNLTQSYDPSQPTFLNTLSSLSVKDGYWLKVSEDVSLDVEGPVPSGASINVKSGWNLVGYPRSSGEGVADELTSLGSTVVQIKDLGSSYDPSQPSFLNTLSTMAPGSGYWLNVDADGTWTVGTVVEISELNFAAVKTRSDHSPEEKAGPAWGEATVYPNLGATVLAKVSIQGKPVAKGGVVAAFVGNELRGLQGVVLDNGISYVTLNVNLNGAETVSYRVWNPDDHNEYLVSGSMLLELGSMYGKPELMELNAVTVVDKALQVFNVTSAPFGFSFNTAVGRSYTVEATGNLQRWKAVELFQGSGGEIRFTAKSTSSGGAQFFRVFVK